ncbi:MAG: hypothetical protein GF349_02260 [Candidatus Magasanikbacteria bacterium]|nr:hypothetical protein [Candidatus Magasanikbacteria bacterium]
MKEQKSEYQNSAIENKKERDNSEAIKSLYRGVWAKKLVNGEKLPIGGSLFNNQELTLKLELDFDTFEEQLESFTEENIKNVYEQNKNLVISWLDKVGSDVDPYTYFLCYQVQQKIHKLLEVVPNTLEHSTKREKKYSNQNIPKLSELKGISECGERAALGQYLFQRVGVESAYVSGICMKNAKDVDEFPDNHSFIVFKNPTNTNSSLIFDIARPRTPDKNVPRILETDVPFTYDLLKNEKDLLVESTEVLQGGKLWFGVGKNVAGHHETLKKDNKSK